MRLGSARFRLGSASQPLGSARLGLGLGLGLGSALGGSGRLSSSSGGLGSAWLGSARSAQLGSARLGSEIDILRRKTTYLLILRESKVQLQLGLVSTRLGFDTLSQPASRLGSVRLGFASVRPANQPARLSLGLALGSGLAQLEDGLAWLRLPEGSARRGSALEGTFFSKLRESPI